MVASPERARRGEGRRGDPAAVDRARARWQSATEMAPSPRPVNRGFPRVAARLARLALLAGLGACSLFAPQPEPRGNRLDPELLAQVTPGVQTRQDVTAILGSPSATGTFDQENWYYISGTSRTRPGRVPGMEDKRVVVVSFDRAGVVRDVRQLDEKDMRDVDVVSRETPVPGNERTVLQALFGNIGRFGAGGLGAGSDTGPAGGPGSGR